MEKNNKKSRRRRSLRSWLCVRHIYHKHPTRTSGTLTGSTYAYLFECLAENFVPLLLCEFQLFRRSWISDKVPSTVWRATATITRRTCRGWAESRASGWAGRGGRELVESSGEHGHVRCPFYSIDFFRWYFRHQSRIFFERREIITRLYHLYWPPLFASFFCGLCSMCSMCSMCSNGSTEGSGSPLFGALASVMADFHRGVCAGGGHTHAGWANAYLPQDATECNNMARWHPYHRRLARQGLTHWRLEGRDSPAPPSAAFPRLLVGDVLFWRRHVGSELGLV